MELPRSLTAAETAWNHRAKGSAVAGGTKMVSGGAFEGDQPGPLLPPPPPGAPPPPPGEVRGWRKVLAILGVVFAFPFFFTIPGWFALSAYRGWKSGKRKQPNLLIAWGVIGPVVLTLTVAAAIWTNTPRTTPPTDAYGYTAGQRHAFIVGCTDQGSAQSTCECVLDEIEKRFTPDEFTAEGTRYQSTGKYSPKMLEAVKSCI